MPHYIAFLRGINFGNRRIKMDDLRARFEEMKFADVTTFIASGNVIFTSKQKDSRKLERQIQDHLHQSLGYGVDTFVRTWPKWRRSPPSARSPRLISKVRETPCMRDF
ncbi:MAG: DUF1697 domain-containing protein [Opitutus sp.]|nr:DUF1697 domain-containing protein [Opitutus sp.]